MRSVLLVGYWHPPAVGAAAQRLAAMARWLPEYDWRPTVLAAGSPRRDDPPGLIRVPDITPTAIASFPDYEWPPAARPARRFRLPRGWLVPDRFLFWRRRARRVARRRLAAAPPHAVIATFPPASAAALGADLADDFGAPLVLDMRDLWFGPGGYAPPPGWRLRAHEQLEQRVAARAAVVTAVSDPMASFLAERYRKPRERVVTMPNGFESEPDVQPSGLTRPATARVPGSAPGGPRGFVLAHVGTVIPRNRPDLFFSAVTAAPQRERWRREGVRFRFVGNLSPAVAARAELFGLVESTGIVPADAARREMIGADALLLLVGDYVGRWGHNAKAFDYLSAGRPILCLEESPGSNDRRLLESLDRDRCVFAPLGDAVAVADAIDAIRAKAGAFEPTPIAALHGLAMYGRRSLCRRLADAIRVAVELGAG